MVAFAQLAAAQVNAPPVLRPLKTEAVWMRDCLRANNSDAEVCALDWSALDGASVSTDVITALVPQRAGDTLTVQSLRTRAPMVRWTARPALPNSGATGTVRNAYVEDEIRVSANFDRIMFAHAVADEEPDFYNTHGALVLRGATVRALGCDSRAGVSFMRAEAVTAPGRLPFLLVTVSTFSPPYSATVVDLSGAEPSLQRASAFFGNARWSRCPS